MDTRDLNEEIARNPSGTSFLEGNSFQSNTPVPSWLRQPTEGSGGNCAQASSVTAQNESQTRKPLRRFIPEPTETTRTSNRRGNPELRSPSEPSQTGPRKFEPQLIEAATRSFHKGEITDSYCNIHLGSHHGNPTHTHRRANSIDSRNCYAHVDPASWFSYASLSQHEKIRMRSFQAPDLPAIPSSSSEGSSVSIMPSLFTSPSASSDESVKRVRLGDWHRESCDEKFSGYLLSLAARSAEKQWKEQALTAFPNDQLYQPVVHFATDKDKDSDEEDASSEPPTFRRESSADISWELEHLRRHKEKSEKRERVVAEAAERPLPSNDLNVDSTHCSKATGGRQRENGLAQMKYAASPPMLGSDLVFPQSLEPICTLYGKGNATRRGKRRSDNAFGKCGGLWYAEQDIDNSRDGGLWMGTCRKTAGSGRASQETPLTETMFPNCGFQGSPAISGDAAETDDYINDLFSTLSGGDPPVNGVNAKPTYQEETDREFDDRFVTQIYNYLSLGYPCVARYYDRELSEISGIPLEDLRRDDLRTDPRGYVVIAEGSAECKGVAGETCMRWVALRLYIHEWARRQPKTPEGNGYLESRGVCERKGSWAV